MAVDLKARLLRYALFSVVLSSVSLLAITFFGVGAALLLFLAVLGLAWSGRPFKGMKEGIIFSVVFAAVSVVVAQVLFGLLVALTGGSAGLAGQFPIYYSSPSFGFANFTGASGVSFLPPFIPFFVLAVMGVAASRVLRSPP